MEVRGTKSKWKLRPRTTYVSWLVGSPVPFYIRVASHVSTLNLCPPRTRPTRVGTEPLILYPTESRRWLGSGHDSRVGWVSSTWREHGWSRVGLPDCRDRKRIPIPPTPPLNGSQSLYSRWVRFLDLDIREVGNEDETLMTSVRHYSGNQ